MGIMNSQGEQSVGIKFCIRLHKSTMEIIIKLFRKAYGCECMAESTIHKRHSTFSKNLNEAPLTVKKGGRPQMPIMETNINTVCAVIDDDWHLSTKAIEDFLHINDVQGLSLVPHMLTSDQIRIRVVRFEISGSLCRRYDLPELSGKVQWDLDASLWPAH